MSDIFPPANQDKTPPCVLQLIPRLSIGGAERTALDVSRALVRAGWRSLVASSGGPLQAVIEQSGGEHVRMPLHSKNPLVVLANAWRLQRCIRDLRVDVLHVRSRMPAWSALLAARRAGVPLVATYHSAVHGHPVWKRFYNSVMTRGDVVIAKSRFNGACIRAVHSPFAARLEVIVAGVDMEAFSPQRLDVSRLQAQRRDWRGDGRPLVLLPGRLDRNKGHEVFLDALARIEAPARPVGVLLGGSSRRSAQRYREALMQRVRALSLQGDVVFADGMEADAMPLAYAAADVVVAPSVFREPFGRVAVEAQAMERPVIAADIGGFRETIRARDDERTGWLVPSGDADALARALEEALSLGRQGRLEMGRRGRKHVAEAFSMKKMCAATLALYRELL